MKFVCVVKDSASYTWSDAGGQNWSLDARTNCILRGARPLRINHHLLHPCRKRALSFESQELTLNCDVAKCLLWRYAYKRVLEGILQNVLFKCQEEFRVNSWAQHSYRVETSSELKV